MNDIPLIICGFGNIGRAFAELIEVKKKTLQDEYGISFLCKAIIEINGSAVSQEGLPLMEIVSRVKQGKPPEDHPEYGRQSYNAFDALEEFEPGVFIECTPTDLQTGEPGLSHVRAALRNKWHVVLANKGPLIKAFKELHDYAGEAGVSLKISAAAAAALPTIDVGEVSLAGTELLKFEGVLNGTTNYILTRMFCHDESYQDALKQAQDLGIAEANPVLDVEGWDTANKTLIIANTLMGCGLQLSDIDVSGIASINENYIRGIKESGKTVKLIGKAERTGGQVKAVVKPEVLDREHPLFNVNGGEKGIVFISDTLGKIVVTGGESSTTGTAASILKDIINIYR
ncbi:homoserine dehydrogenase [candidate division KSB1 bacterium]